MKIFRTSSPEDSISGNSERTDPRRWGEETGYIEVLQQSIGRLNIKRLLIIKENKISQVKKWLLFYVGRCKNLHSLKSLLWYVFQLFGASILCLFVCFHILGSLGFTIGSGCSLMVIRPQIFFFLLYGSLNSHGKYTGLICHSLLQWIMFCQNSLLWPVCLGWPCMAWLRASLS